MAPRLAPNSSAPFFPWFLVGNEGMRALYNPLKGICRALIPSFPTKNQPVLCKEWTQKRQAVLFLSFGIQAQVIVIMRVFCVSKQHLPKATSCPMSLKSSTLSVTPSLTRNLPGRKPPGRACPPFGSTYLVRLRWVICVGLGCGAERVWRFPTHGHFCVCGAALGTKTLGGDPESRSP